MATDTHLVIVPGVSAPQALPHPFAGLISGALSSNVRIMGKPAATVGSTATNTPAHVPTAPGTAFQAPPSNQGSIQSGSASVMINGKGAARNGDVAETCNDPVNQPVGKIVAVGTVFMG